MKYCGMYFKTESQSMTVVCYYHAIYGCNVRGNSIFLLLFSGEKPYACSKEGCTKAFSTNYSLKTHKNRHSKDHPLTVKEVAALLRLCGF